MIFHYFEGLQAAWPPEGSIKGALGSTPQQRDGASGPECYGVAGERASLSRVAGRGAEALRPEATRQGGGGVARRGLPG